MVVDADRDGTALPFAEGQCGVGDVRTILRQIYRGSDGYAIPDGEKRRVARAHSKATYGELLPTATLRLLEHLQPTAHDVFYDLGSGIGQVTLHVALATAVAQSVGVELVGTRHATAEAARSRALALGCARARACTLLNRDFLRVGLGDATLVYTCSTAFPAALLRKLATKLARGRLGLRLVTLQPLGSTPWFAATATLRLDTSWQRRTPVHVYRLTRRAP